MNLKAKLSGEQLEDAFLLFNQMSEKLTESYAELQTQVAHLSAELTEARCERLKQLAEKERLASRLEGLLNTLPAGIVVLDETGTINQYNPIAEDMLGKGLMGQSWQSLAKKVLINDGNELRLLDQRWVSISVRPLGSEPGKLILITDITETRSLQKTVNRQQRLTSLGEMVASLAHQIRTPLASALLYLSNISHPEASQKDRQRFTVKAKERLHHLERMVNDMLVFVQGGVTASECFSVDTFVEDLRQYLQPQLSNTQAILHIVNLTHDAGICGNRDALLGAFQNLANNAIQACDQEPILKLNISYVSDNSILFEFIDNGKGIPEKLKERVMEPFFTTRSNGTGLGLAVVNATVNSFKGKLDIQSEPDTGSRFCITLPLAHGNDMLPSDIVTSDSNNAQTQYKQKINNSVQSISELKRGNL